MDDIFKNLKEKMDTTILKDVDFTEDSKDKVRRSVKTSKMKKRIIVKPKINYILSVSTSLLLLFGLGFFTFNKLGHISDSSLQESNEQNLTTEPENNDNTSPLITDEQLNVENDAGNSYIDGNPNVILNDATHAYSVDEDGNMSISYRDGSVTANVPLKIDTTGQVMGMGPDETGIYISEDITAIVYGFADGTSKPLNVLISNDMGESWKEYTIEGAMGYDTKFIGFTNQKDGWIVTGGSAGVGKSLNHIYQTSDGGQNWEEIGNANDIYAEQLTGVGFSNKNIGFLGFRYYEDQGPVIYWTRDRGQSWERLSVSLPKKFDQYNKTPRSPIFNGKEGLFPISLSDDSGVVGNIYLYSNDEGRSWAYDESYDMLTE